LPHEYRDARTGPGRIADIQADGAYDSRAKGRDLMVKEVRTKFALYSMLLQLGA